MISTVTGWRPLQTGPMGHVMSFKRHPTNLSVGARIRTRSRCFADIFRATRTGADHLRSSPGRIRTVDPLFVRQVPSPLGHRTVLLFVERRPWDSNPQVFRPAVFKTASSPIRVTSVSYESKHRGQESNLRPSGSEPDATTNSCYPGSGNRRTEHCGSGSPSSGKRIRTSIT